MNKKNNVGLLIFAIVFLILAIIFFIVSGNLEFSSNTNTIKKISSNSNIAYEDFVGNSVTNSVANSITNLIPNTIANSVTNNVASVSTYLNETDYQTSAETGVLNSVTEYQNFIVYDKSGEEVSLDSFSGNPVFILFWQNEEDSVEMLEMVNKMYSSYSDKITFLTVINASEKSVVEQYVAENNIQVPIYYEQNSVASKAYNISVYPSIIIKDKNNTIINTKEGKQDEDSILANLDILSENY
jgi:glycine cleavage system pyridoxal-binding protein P